MDQHQSAPGPTQTAAVATASHRSFLASYLLQMSELLHIFIALVWYTLSNTFRESLFTLAPFPPGITWGKTPQDSLEFLRVGLRNADG